MKRIFFVVVVLVMCASFAIAQKDAKALEGTLIQMDKDWTAAELRGDTKAAGMYVADDFWQTTPEGVLQNKTQYLAALKATKDTDMADEYSVRFFGDVAIMTHRGTVKGEKPLQYRSTHVWANRGGKWQIVAHHSSDIAPPTAKPSVSPAAADAAAPAKKPVASPSALAKP